VHRSFIYPFQIRVKPGDSTPLLVILMGSLYCGINGYLNGSYISNYADHLNEQWLTDPRFVLGVALFGFGYYLNKRSDSILRNLRASSTTGYQIPQGFAFRYVSMPNYLGEILTWTGFAIASWSLAGLSFVVFTMANLVPRALANHRWYREQFSNYPRERRAIFPFVL
jgi:steroid 5-alpha reductase family enzyme